MPRGDDGSDFTVILPTYNEAGNIHAMLESLTTLYPEARILVADDDSNDGTANIVDRFSLGSPGVRVIRRDPKDRGLTASIMQGIMESDTEYFVVMDADFQHPPESVGDLVESLRGGNDMVIGVRQDKMELPFGRKMASWGANFMAHLYLGLKRQPTSEDTMSGFFGGRTDVCHEVIAENGGRFERQGFKVLFDLLKYMPRKASISEVCFKFNSRRAGESKLSSRIIISIMRQCGIGGKIMAYIAAFFLTNMLGRFLASLTLGLLFTFWVLRMTGVVLDSTMTTSIVLSFVLAMAYLVIANKFLFTHGRRDGLVIGAKLVFTGFSGYLINMYIFYMASSVITQVQMLSMFLGFGIGYVCNAISSAIPDR